MLVNNQNIKITFLGAAECITGSCFLVTVETGNGPVKLLVDCGLYQRGNINKKRQLNGKLFPVKVQEIDFIILTHAHIDHSGRIPLLWKQGYRNPVFCTNSTFELCKIMLPDAGHIQEQEANQYNKKANRAGRAPILPLYTKHDAQECLSLFKPIPYGKLIDLGNVRFRFRNSKHILGSAFVELWIRDKIGIEKKIVFSGDVGNNLRTKIDYADFVILESTYGNRYHTGIDETERIKKLAEVVIETYLKNGSVIIPAFAVGRTQQLIYSLNEAIKVLPREQGEIISKIPIFIDTPMGTAVTRVFSDTFNRRYNDLICLFGRKGLSYYKERGINPFVLPKMKFTVTTEESQALNNPEPKIIISASGMCNAGRILHHLRHNLWKQENTILFVGYQAEGTLGRKIVDGAKKVTIFGEEIAVKARIENIPEFSAHADQKELLKFLKNIKTLPKGVFLVHGEPQAQLELAKKIEELGIEVVIPKLNSTYAIANDKIEELASYAAHQEVSTFENRLAETISALDRLVLWFEDIEKEFDNFTLQDFDKMSLKINELYSFIIKVRRMYKRLNKKLKQFK